MIELRAGDARVAIDPARGGRLASFAIGGRELLVGPWSPDDTGIRWGCFLMAPWPGRLARGRFAWAGRDHQLTRDHGRHAIHGLGWSRPWRVLERDAASATLELDLDAAGWPMGGTVRERVVLGPGTLRLEAGIHARDSMPGALGWHPWFLRRGGARVRLDAEAAVEVEAMIPTGRLLPIAGKLDLRSGPELGDRRLDDAYAGVRSPITISWPDLELRMSFGPAFDTAVVYTPPDFFCVEPQTAPPNALQTDDATLIPAGGSFETAVTLEWG